jgi:hypothetical protein
MPAGTDESLRAHRATIRMLRLVVGALATQKAPD